MAESETRIEIVKRGHRWLVKRGETVRRCSICGLTSQQTETLVCYEEEVEVPINGEG